MTKLTKTQEKRFEKYIYEELLEYGWSSLMVLVKDFLANELSRQKKEIIEKLEKLDKVGAVKLKSGKIIRTGEFNLIFKDQAIKTIKKI